MLKFTVLDLKDKLTETLIVPVCEDHNIHSHEGVREIMNHVASIKEFKGKKDDQLILYDLPNVKVKRAIMVGVGKAAQLSCEAFRAGVGTAVHTCMKKGLTDIVIAAPDEQKSGVDQAKLLKAMFEGAFLANDSFDRYKEKKEYAALKSISLLVVKETALASKPLPAEVEAICTGTIIAREWVNVPPNDKRPDRFAQAIKKACTKTALLVRILDEKILKTEKMGAMIAVAQGSKSKPRLVILEYKPRGAKRKVALVGKGVTFDTGGLNLKSGDGMAEMKMDMAGAAAVFGTMIALSGMKVDAHVIGVLPLVENMLSGDSYRPSDIITSYSGKTIEIGNTDAEGRLILIDAMAWSEVNYAPDIMIDMATLTGACVVALGEKIAGVFSGDDHLAESILASGERTYERCWRMPMPDDYKELLKSDFADISNMSHSKYGGAIAAALFLSAFVRDTAWAHIDIAGPAYSKKATPYCGPGGTGFGVRLLCDLIQHLGQGIL